MNPLLLLLAAGPAVPPVPPAPVSDPLSALYVLIGSTVVLQLIGMGVGLVKWLGARTVSREDADKAELKKRLDGHDGKFEELDDTLSSMDRTVSTIQLEMKQMLSTVESTRGMVAEIKGAMDTRFEKQADFYRVQVKELMAGVQKSLEDLEYKLRQDMTRAAHDAAQLAKGRGRKGS